MSGSTTGNHAPRIGLLGPFGWGNLGDAAIQDAVIQNIRSRWPDAHIFGFSLNPDDTEDRHGLPSYPLYRWWESYKQQLQSQAQALADRAGKSQTSPVGRPSIKELLKTNPLTKPLFRLARAVVNPLREAVAEMRFLVQCYRILRDLDLLVMSGGGQLDDFWGGAWRQPYTLLKFSLLARLAGAGPVYLSVGVGSMQSFASRFMFKTALRLSRYRSLRDERSLDKMQRIGLGGRTPVEPDLAFSLRLESYRLPDEKPGLIGVNPVAAFDPRAWPEKNQATYERWLEQLAIACADLVKDGYRLSIFPSEINMDVPVIADLQSAMRRHGVQADSEAVTCPPVSTVEDLLARMNECSCIVASRFHGVLLALRIAKPVIALSYHMKIDALMESQGQSKYCLDIESFTHTELTNMFEELSRNRSRVIEDSREKARVFERLLDKQYDLAFSEVGLRTFNRDGATT